MELAISDQDREKCTFALAAIPYSKIPEHRDAKILRLLNTGLSTLNMQIQRFRAILAKGPGA